MKKAKVFISCGQLTKEEKEIGLGVYEYFKKDFSPYFAEQYHTPKGLTEHIFHALKDSEYYISINFERDKSEVGSLFVQQELAEIQGLACRMRKFL